MKTHSNADLKRRITKNGKLWGFEYIDRAGNHEIIMANSLREITVFDQLSDNGWELRALPYLMEKNGVSINDLPEIDFNEAGITKDQEQELMDFSISIPSYSDQELIQRITSTKGVAGFPRKQSKDFIKTREKFLEFLEMIDNAEELDSAFAFMPINSFVSPNALFTPEEFFSNEYQMYRDIILRRRTMSLTNHIKLVEQLQREEVLGKNFTNKELVNAYFAWGICGLNVTVIATSEELKDTPLDLKYSYEVGEDNAIHNRLKYVITGAIDKTGKVYIENGTSHAQNYVIDMIDQKKVEVDGLIKRDIENEIVPIPLSRPYSETVTTLRCKGVDIIYNSTQIKYIPSVGDTGVIFRPVYRVKMPRQGTYLNPLLTNTTKPEVRNEIYIELFSNTIAEMLKKRLTVKTTGSSIKALQKAGLGKIASYNKIISDEGNLLELANELYTARGVEAGDLFKSSEDMLKLKHDILGEFRQFLMGNLMSDSLEHEVFTRFLENVDDGLVNIDNTKSGDDRDLQSNRTDALVPYIKLAMSMLGVPAQTIYDKVKAVTPKTRYIDFNGKGKVVRLRLTAIDAKQKGFVSDTNLYRIQSMSEATTYLFITDVFSEVTLAPLENPRHVAALGKRFYFDTRNAKLKSVVNNIQYDIENTILTHCSPDRVEMLRQQTGQNFEYLVRKSVVSAALTGFYMRKEAWAGSDEKVVVSQEDYAILKSFVDNFFDTTYSISEVMTDGTNWNFAIVNATIINERVVPNQDAGEIKERAFVPHWVDTRAGVPSGVPQEVVRKFIQDGVLEGPFPGLREMSQYSDPKHRFDGVVSGTEYDPITGEQREVIPMYAPIKYYNFATELKTHYPEDKEFDPRLWKSFLSVVYPELYGTDDVDSVKVARRLDNSPRRNYHQPIKSISYQTMIERDPEIRSIIEMSGLEDENEIVGIFPMKSLSSEDMLETKTLEEVINYITFDKKLKRPIQVINNKMYFDQHGFLDFTEVTMLDPSIYAVKQLKGRRYVIEDITNNLWEVIV